MHRNFAKGLVVASVAVCMVGAAARLHAQEQIIKVRGNMSGSQENPPISPGTGANGYAECDINVASREADCVFTVFNIPSGSTQAHIHVGPPGANGPVVIPIDIPPQFSNDLTVRWRVTAAGLVLRPDAGIRSIDDLIEAGVGGNWYVNVHTNINPGGEIRGQLCPESREANTRTGVAICTTPAK